MDDAPSSLQSTFTTSTDSPAISQGSAYLAISKHKYTHSTRSATTVKKSTTVSSHPLAGTTSSDPLLDHTQEPTGDTDKRSYKVDQQNHPRYHEWGEAYNNSATIKLLPLLQLINKTFQPQPNHGPFPAFISVHKNDNKPTMWISSRTMKWDQRTRDDQRRRLTILLPHFQRALQVQLYQHQERFPALLQALAMVGSIPLMFDLSDYLGCCNPDNTNDKVVLYNASSPPPDVAYFTISKPVSCHYGFPIPSYSTYKYATTLVHKQYHGNWTRQLQRWNYSYPWDAKIEQVYWRGERSGRFLTHRLEFLQKIVADNEQHKVNHENQSIFNVHTTLSVDGCDECPSVKRLRDPPEESMKYKATFDLDGHAWSERFPRLLCYNSVVIKINVPHENEEYFMGHSVVPGIHYVPADLHNFTQVARMVLDPRNGARMRKVVGNANEWCVERLNEETLNLNFLSVLNGYVETLEEGWGTEWKRAFAAHVGPAAARNGHGGFHSTVVDNNSRRGQYTNPTVKGLEGPTAWHLDDYEVPSSEPEMTPYNNKEIRVNIQRSHKGPRAVQVG